jgi:hypothetical protein
MRILIEPEYGLTGSETERTEDRWLYRFSGSPPAEFRLHKILFSAETPARITSAGYRVLLPAVPELVTGLGMKPSSGFCCTDSLRKLRESSGLFDWLNLANAGHRACLTGIHEKTTVAAAAPLSAVRHPFIPMRFFSRMAANPEWKNLRCDCSYRHFLIRFDTGLTFYTDRHGLLCSLTFGLHFGVHGVHSLWGTLRIEDDRHETAVPFRLRVSPGLDDLPRKAGKLAGLARQFVRKAGSSHIWERDEDLLWRRVAPVLADMPVPVWRRNELRESGEIAKCFTRLELLRFLSGLLDEGEQTVSPSYRIRLSQTLFKKEFQL